jgi:hypothetical protein
MKKTAMPARSASLPPGKPLPRGKALRRVGIVRAATLAAAGRTLAPKRKGTVGEFPLKTRRLIFGLFHGRCAWCGDPLPPKWWTAQHRRARGAGGTSDPLAVSAANGLPVHQIPCHEYIESHPTEALHKGFRIPQGSDPRQWPCRIWTGEWGYPTEDGGWRPVAAKTEERS